MKRKLLATLAMPFALATGCGDDADTATFVDAFLEFSGAISVGTEIVGEYSETSDYRNYIVYEGEVYEIDDFPTFVTTDEENCSVIAENQIATTTRDSWLRKGTFVERVVGTQQFWIVRESSSGDNSWDSAEMGTVDSLYDADWYSYNPRFAAYDYNLFEGSSNSELDYGGQANGFITNVADIEAYNQYWYNKLVDEITATFVEQSSEYDSWETDVTITWYNDVVTTETSRSIDYGYDYWTYVQTILDGWIWEVDESNVPDHDWDYNNDVDADQIVPEGVQVGDTWIQDNSFWSAITTDNLDMANGVTIEALVIVQRGRVFNNVQNADAFDTCIDFFYSDETTTENEPADTVTDEVDLDADRSGVCDNFADDPDFTNENVYWYYGGLFVRESMWERGIDVWDYGYVWHDPIDGSCDIFSFDNSNLPVAGVSVTEVEQYRPFIKFQVQERSNHKVAKEFRRVNRALEDYLDVYGPNATADTGSDTTAPTDSTDTTEEETE